MPIAASNQPLYKITFLNMSCACMYNFDPSYYLYTYFMYYLSTQLPVDNEMQNAVWSPRDGTIILRSSKYT